MFISNYSKILKINYNIIYKNKIIKFDVIWGYQESDSAGSCEKYFDNAYVEVIQFNLKST